MGMRYETEPWRQEDSERRIANANGSELLAAITAELEDMLYSSNGTGKMQTRHIAGYPVAFFESEFNIGIGALRTTSLPEAVRYLYNYKVQDVQKRLP